MKKTVLVLLFGLGLYTNQQAQCSKMPVVKTGTIEFDIFTPPTYSFDRTSNLLCYSEKIGTVNFYDIEKNLATTYDLGKESTVVFCLFHPKKDIVAIGCKDGILTLYDYVAKKVLITKQAHKKSVTAATYSENGDTLYTAGKEDRINVWTETGDSIKSFETASSAKSIHIRGKQIIYNNEKMKNCVRIIDFATAAEKIINVKVAYKMAVTKDGKTAYVSMMGETQVWNLVSGTMERTILNQRSVKINYTVALSKDDEFLMYGGEEKKLFVFGKDGQELLSQDLPNKLYSVCISPNNKYCAAFTDPTFSSGAEMNLYKIPTITYPTNTKDYCYTAVMKYQKGGTIDYAAYFFQIKAPAGASESAIKQFGRCSALDMKSDYDIIEEALDYEKDCSECKKAVTNKYTLSNFQVNRIKMPL